MNKLFITANGAVLLNTDTAEAKSVPSETRGGIYRTYLIEEDATIIYERGTCSVETEVHAGQIVVEFYNSSLPHVIVVFDSPEWKENIL